MSVTAHPGNTLVDAQCVDACRADVLVDATGVARTFGSGPGAVVALHDVTCQIRRGQHIALSGPSGSGKSTLVHLLAGLDRPTVGTICWPTIGPAESLRPGPVAVIFQAPSLLPALDVAENVALPLLLRGISASTARIRAEEALELLDLGTLADKLPEEISGGQAQRVAIARTLADAPQLMFADEPTGQLDRRSADQVIDALILAAERTDAALIVNTHDDAIAHRFPIRWTMRAGALRTGATLLTANG